MKLFKGKNAGLNLSTETDISSRILEETQALSKKYSELGINHPEGVWTRKHLKTLRFDKFREDNVYVWQTRTYNEINFFISYLYCQRIDKLELRDKIKENGDFGVETYLVDGKTISRDFIDSLIEVNYLEEMLHISQIPNLHVLDIGAGYGRLARRITEAFPEVHITCLDAIPTSTCISKIYLEKEIQANRVTVRGLDTIAEIPKGQIRVALNVHSFSEMSLASVSEWVGLLVEKEIPDVFVVPNGEALTLNDGTDFGFLFKDAGYRIVDRRSKYQGDGFSKFGIYPSTYFLLHRTFP